MGRKVLFASPQRQRTCRRRVAMEHRAWAVPFRGASPSCLHDVFSARVVGDGCGRRDVTTLVVAVQPKATFPVHST
jgi:hypothetical protein